MGIAKEERGEFLPTVALAVGEVVGNELSSLHAEGSKAVALSGGAHEKGEGYLGEVETGDVGRLRNFCECCAGTAVQAQGGAVGKCDCSFFDGKFKVRYARRARGEDERFSVSDAELLA